MNMSSARKKSTPGSSVTGKVVSTVPGFVLVKKPKIRVVRDAPPSERAASLFPKIAKALNRPGISKDVVFKGRTHNVYSYSVDTTDTTRVIRVDAQGNRAVGRLVGEKFVPLRSA
jgi:hypothetical protein